MKFSTLNTLAVLVLALPCLAALADGKQAIDCPLRDEPYSINAPLMDILLKPEAVAAANRHMDNKLDELPAQFASPQAPSFSAILTLGHVVSMAQLGTETLAAVDKELRLLEVTEADRAARCARYDVEPPVVAMPVGTPRILLFEKITGFRDGPSVDAANAALRALAKRNGWALVVTDKAAIMTPAILEQFDSVIWNNVSGDVLTLSQRQSFKDYIDAGGGYVGVHGSAGDPTYFWDWYVDELVGARFIGHPMDPQFQDALVRIEIADNGIGSKLVPGWTLNEEWYSFQTSPRAIGASVIATLDESTYSPVGRGGQDLRMGDHPIAWTRCIGDGRSFYSAIGHRPQVYADPRHLELLEQGIHWAAGRGKTRCVDGNLIGPQ